MEVRETNFDISVKSYLGKLNDGILVLLSVKYNSKIYECSYWYTEDLDVITFDEDLRRIIGEFEKLTDKNKKSIISFLRENTSDYNELIKELDDFKG